MSLSLLQRERLEIEKSITQHNDAILGLQRRYNALASTSYLPPELLAEIFTHHAFADSAVPRNERDRPADRPPHARRHKQPSYRPYTWITITHVCSHWRAVALSCPRLWGTIWITRLECVQEMLARSKRVPLSIKANVLASRMDSLELVMRELPRIVCFDVKMPSHMPKREFASEAPHLKELVLQSAEGYEMLTLGTSQLQSHFMKCDVPSLEKLELYAFQVQWSNPLLRPTIKNLALHATGVSATLFTEEVLVALDKLPLLETLNLKNVLPHIAGPLPEVSRVISLPRLRKLHVYATASACANFLRHTAFSPKVTMTLDCHVQNSAETTMLFPLILSKFNTNQGTGERAPLLRSVSIQTSPGTLSTQLKGWTSFHDVQKLSERPQTGLPEPFVELSVRISSQFSLFSFFRAIPSSTLESLYVDPSVGARRADKAEWTNMFGSLPILRQLGVGRWAQENLHQVLEHRVYCEEDSSSPSSSSSSKRGSRRRKEPCLPNLSLLLLNNMYIRPSPARDDDGGDILFTRLRKALGLRQKTKAQLDTLVVRSCANLYKEDVDSLRRFVRTVEWDGVNKAEGLHNLHGWDSDYDDEEIGLLEEEFDDLGHPFFAAGDFGGMWGEPDPWGPNGWPEDQWHFDAPFDAFFDEPELPVGMAVI